MKRLTAKELEIFTEGLSIPESACSRPVIDRPPIDSTRPGLQILRHVKVRAKRVATTGRNARRAPSKAMTGRWTI